MSPERCFNITSIVPSVWRVLSRPKSDPRPCLYHLRFQQQHFHLITRHCDGIRNSQAGDRYQSFFNENVKLFWDDIPGVPETASDPILDEPLGIEHVNVVGEEKTPYRIVQSEKRRLRLHAAVAWSQVHKENKRKKRDEHERVKSIFVDWRTVLELLKKETKAECVDQHQDVVRYTNFTPDVSPDMQIRGDQIEPPQQWTVITFALYVRSLVNSRVTPVHHRHLYKGHESHATVVADVIDRLFEDSSLYAYWSVGACNDALRFFYKHWMIHRVRALYSRMETRRFITSTETINIMIHAAAQQRKLSEVQGLLRSMLKKNLKPDAHTWQAFFLMNSTDARYEIFLAMQERGLLQNPQSMSSFFSLNIRAILCAMLDQGRSVTWFLEFMDKSDGFDWLSTRSGNIIIDEVGKRGLPEDALSIFDELIVRGLKPDEITLNILLHRCLPDRHHDLAIQALRKLAAFSVSPGKDAYEALFTQFWRSRQYSCARVIWRYACLHDRTTFKMRWLVGRSLATDEPKKGDDHASSPKPRMRGPMWHPCAGKVVVGADCTFQNPGTGAMSLEETTTASAASWSAVFEQDLAAAYQYRAARSLASMLDEALLMDRIWALHHIWQHKSLGWMMDNAIAVPLKQLDNAARFLPKLPASFKHSSLQQEDSYDGG